jgi:hypothetical protein
MVEDDSREFRLAVLNDLVDAEGRSGAAPAAAAGPDRYRVLFFGAAATAGILAVTLVMVLVTGGGSGSKSKTTDTKKTTVATTPGFVTTSVNVVDTRVPENVGPNSRVTFAKVDGTVVAGNVLVLSVRRAKDALASTALDINVSNEDAVKLRSFNPKELFISVGDAAAATTTTSAPPATAPPSTSPPGTTTPSS